MLTPACTLLATMESNLLRAGEKLAFSSGSCAVTVKQRGRKRESERKRAEFSTKDSATAERRYPGNALCCGVWVVVVGAL